MATSNLKEVVSHMQRVSRRLVDVRRDVGALTREVQTLLDELDRLMPGLTDPDGDSGVRHERIDAYRIALNPKEYPSGKVYQGPDTHTSPYRDTHASADTTSLYYQRDLWDTDSRGVGE